MYALVLYIRSMKGATPATALSAGIQLSGCNALKAISVQFVQLVGASGLHALQLLHDPPERSSVHRFIH